MKEKKTYYLIMMALVLLLTFMVPVLIKAGSSAFIRRFAPNAVPETETEGGEQLRVMEGYTEAEKPLSESEPLDFGKDAGPDDVEVDEVDPEQNRDQLQAKKEQMDNELSSYLKKQNPDI